MARCAAGRPGNNLTMTVRRLRPYVPKRGDIVWTDFNPARGREQKGRRPGLIVSAEEFNRRSGLAYTVPITSKRKGYPIEVPIQAEHVRGAILTSHLRAIDWHTRSVEFIERCPEAALAETLGKIIAYLTTD